MLARSAWFFDGVFCYVLEKWFIGLAQQFRKQQFGKKTVYFNVILVYILN